MKHAIFSLLFLVLIASTTQADIINGGFENGNFDGWDVTIPYGESEFYGWRPAGSAYVTDDNSFGRTATEGLNMASIGTGDEYFLGNEIWQISASQDIYLNAMDILSGDAFFYNGDYLPQDSGWVKIFDEFNNELSTPWLQYSGILASGLASTEYQTATEWSQWQWQAEYQGNYRLVLGVSTSGDNAFDCYAQFDNIQIQQVPEPQSIFLIGLALFAGSSAILRKKHIFYK